MPDLTGIFAPGTVTGWEALLAVVILGASFVAAHFAKKAVLSLGERMPGLHPELVSFLARVTKYSLILFAIGVDLALLGANIQPLLAAVLIVGVVGFLALRGVAGNIGAGVIIQSRRSIHVGQFIGVLDFEGIVKELNSRSVVITTRDGRGIHIPNTTLLENPLVNHSEFGVTRSSVEVRVQSERDADELRSVIVTAAKSVPGVDSAHPPEVIIGSASPQHTTFELRIWHAPLDDAKTRSEVVLAIFRSLTLAGVTATVVSAVPALPLTAPPSP